MTKSNLAQRLAAVKVQTLKARLPEDGPNLQKVKDAGQFVSVALQLAWMSQKEAAFHMGLQETQLAAQIANKPGNHLSWHRLCLLPDAFFLELLIVIAEARGVARVRLTLEAERRQG